LRDKHASTQNAAKQRPPGCPRGALDMQQRLLAVVIQVEHDQNHEYHTHITVASTRQTLQGRSDSSIGWALPSRNAAAFLDQQIVADLS